MLEEKKIIVQDEFRKGLKKYWFADEDMELIYWLDKNQKVFSFQLCYDKNHRERAVVWHLNEGLKHYQVDGGEDQEFNRSPVFLDSDKESLNQVKRRFHESSQKIPNHVVQFVLGYLR